MFNGIFGGLWGGVSQSVGQSIGLVSTIYGNQTGLTQQQMAANQQLAELNSKQQQERLKIYTFIAFVIVLAIVIVVIKKRK